MATVLHSVQTDTNGLHEPKGHSTAIIDDYYRLNGSGSGAMKASPCSDYGQLSISANTTGFSLTAAVDGTLKTNTDYVRVSGTGAPWVSAFTNGVTLDTSTGRLTVARTGIYNINFHAVIQFATTSNRVGFKYRLNGTTFGTQRLIIKNQAASDILMLSGFGFVNMSATNYIELMVASDKTTSPIIEECSIAMFLFRET